MSRTMSLLSCALVLAACGEPGADAGSVDTEPGADRAAAAPATVSVDDFGALRWIEGTWRGTGPGQETFYERYTMVDDSTIRSEASPDSTFPDAGEAGSIRLRGGRVTTGDETMEWAVSSIDARSVRFDPVRGASNAFVWTSDSDSTWEARLSWTDRDGVAHEQVYQMRRVQ